MSPQEPKSGFTFAELLVLVGVGAVLTTLLVPTLSETRSKLLQQACVANMKQWGMAFYLYLQDYGGRLYYDVGGAGWADVSSSSTNVYLRYLGGGDQQATIRTMRKCPARAATMTQSQISLSSGFYNYSIPIGMYKRGIVFAQADLAGSPFLDSATGSYFPSLSFLPQPSTFLLLIESSGHTLRCGGLVTATTTVLGTDPDQVPAVNRHGGGVNCLFGDFHVEFVSSQAISNQNTVSCPSGNPWFVMKN
jgi:prepilin-type processing-associated H-X9-DG protein